MMQHWQQQQNSPAVAAVAMVAAEVQSAGKHTHQLNIFAI